MQAPSNFQPVNILRQQQPPAPSIPRYRKFDLYRDASHFRFVDDHAIQVYSLSLETSGLSFKTCLFGVNSWLFEAFSSFIFFL